jgi:hypothetical protein
VIEFVTAPGRTQSFTDDCFRPFRASESVQRSQSEEPKRSISPQPPSPAAVDPAPDAHLASTVRAIGNPTSLQHPLNKAYVHWVLRPEFLEYLFSCEFRVPLPYATNVNSSSGVAIHSPPYSLLNPTSPDSSHTAFPQKGMNPAHTNDVFTSKHGVHLPSRDSRAMLPDRAHRRPCDCGRHAARVMDPKTKRHVQQLLSYPMSTSARLDVSLV